MYQLFYPCVAHDARLFGPLWITSRVRGGTNGVRLQSNSPNVWVYADRRGRVIDCLRKFRLIFACCNYLSQSWRWKSLSRVHSTAMKWFLKVYITLSALFSIWLLGGNNWYSMFMVIIFIFKDDNDFHEHQVSVSAPSNHRAKNAERAIKTFKTTSYRDCAA